MLAAVLREAARRFGDAPALVFQGRGFSFTELDRRADEVAAALRARGVAPGQLVALVLPTGPDYVLAYLALARVGAVTAGVNPRYPAAERAVLLARVGPDAVLAARELAAAVPGGPDLVVEVDPGDPLPELRGCGAPEADLPPDPDRPEVVVFTSGTTGTPKGALFRSRQVAAITAMDVGDQWGGGAPQLVATGLPHVGFMTKLAGNLRRGSAMHLLPRWRADEALEVLARERIPYVGGVAAQVSLLLRVPGFDSYDLSAVRGLIVGAGPSPPALVREARARFRAGYSIRYSSTESGGLATLTASDADDEEIQTVGRPRPGVELELRDPGTGAAVPEGVVGQVCLRSPAVMAGYWGEPEATAAALDDAGWLRTGDLGRLDAAGRLTITGRLSEMFIRGGYNVFPLEVEAVLAEHPAVAAVAVVPRPDPVMGEVGVAVVVPRDEPPTLEGLRAFARERLAAYKVPEALRVVESLPLTSMDKVDRRALARLVSEEED